MNRKSLMSSGLDNESTRNKLKELALYDSETNETLSLSNYAAYFLLLFYIPLQHTDCHDLSE